MPRSSLTSEDPFIRLRSAFRVDGIMHAGLVRPVFSRLERVRPKGNYQFPLHQHHEFEVILIIRGPYYYRLNGENFRLPKDTVLVVEPGDWHEDVCRSPLDYAAILFTLHSRGDGKHLPGLSFFRKNTPLSQRHAPFRASIFLPLLYKIAHESKINDAMATNLQDTLVEEFFWRMARAFDPKRLASWLSPSQSKEVFLARLSTAMSQHVHDSLSVPRLARSLGLSQRTLSLRCATLLGDSPAHVFLRFKIEQARKLLAEKGLSVKEVSSRFGFADPYHFSRAYKSILGFPPSRTPIMPPGQPLAEKDMSLL